MLPELSIGSFVTLPTYFVYLSLLVSLLFFATWKWSGILERDQQIALNLALLIVIFGFIGGRLFHIIYEGPEYYRRFPQAIFMFWTGGYVFYGGMFLASIAGFTYLRIKKQSFWSWFDFLAPVLALGYGLGRFACFLAGCCYGSYCDLPWAVAGRHPTQLYALIIELGFAAFLAKKSIDSNAQRNPQLRWPVGAITLTWLALHSMGRLFMETYRDDFRGPMISGVSISTWVSLILLSAAISGLAFVWSPRIQARREAQKAKKKSRP